MKYEVIESAPHGGPQKTKSFQVIDSFVDGSYRIIKTFRFSTSSSKSRETALGKANEHANYLGRLALLGAEKRETKKPKKWTHGYSVVTIKN